MKPRRILSSVGPFVLITATLASAQDPTLTWDASQELDGDNQWPAVEDPGRAWNLAAPAAALFGATEFPSAGVWFNSPSGAQASLDGLGGTTQDVTWEIVFRPGDLTGNHVLFETGGNGDGSAFVLQGSQLEFRVQDANDDAQRIIASHMLSAADATTFHHVVAAVTLGAAGSNQVELYVNAGAPVVTLGATGDLNDWAGGDAAGLGRLNGGLPTGETGFDPFTGDIALLRYYQGIALSEAQVQAKFDELSSGEVDSDSDGLPDFWELRFLENLDSNADDDDDGDTLNNEDELAAGTDPSMADTDGDTIGDADELAAEPPTSPTRADTDGDGLDDGEEKALGTDPTDVDSDGDGFDDGIEVANGFDPNNPNDPPPGSKAKIIWITENTDGSNEPSPDDIGWNNLLAVRGFDVERRDIRNLDADPVALDELNAADLIIVSRDTNSGNYNSSPDEVAAWNSGITKPLILLSSFLARNNRWFWFNNAGNPVASGNEIQVADPSHPIFRGITLDGDDQFTIIDAQGVNLTGGADGGNGTVLASDPGNGNVWVAHWEAEVEFYPGAGQTTGGPRLWFGAGIQNNNPKGLENFTADGETAFLNAVDFMLGKTGPSLQILTIGYDQANETFTLTWDSKESATYGLFYSTDLIDFGADIDDSIVSDGETTSITFDNPLVGAPEVFFRLVEN